MRKAFLILLVLLLCLSACNVSGDATVDENGAVSGSQSGGGGAVEAPDSSVGKIWTEALADKLAAQEPPPPGAPGPGLAWYQIFVYSFCDSDGDGIGDLNGVTERLDYIKSMGFDGIWLSPIHPSTTYHKYNVNDYLAIDPQYGTMRDFDAMLEACHAKGIRVILDLVINHSDLDHPWFTLHPEYYNISDKPGNGNWELLPSGLWYECQFWGQMPDLNLENLEAREELEKIFEFWLERGVDGFRLDAIKDYFSGNTQKNIEILKWLNSAVKNIKPDAYLVGEVWDTTDSLYQYYESGIDSFFSFPFAGSDGAVAKLLIKSDATMGDYLRKTEAAYTTVKSYNPNATNAPFFTNHDMARAVGFLRRDINLIKTAWGLSLMQPGDAFVYYGEELGMTGSGKDENKRAPMHWTDEKFAAGMAYGPPGMDDISHNFPPAVQQVGDPGSIYTYVKDAVRLRAKYPHIGRGDFKVLNISGTATDTQSKAGAASRTWEGSEIIVAYNVSSEEVTLTLPGALQDALSATGEQPRQEGESIILPGYCIAILTL